MAYDVTDMNSFLSLTNWLDSINENCTDEIPQVIIGNKLDSENRTVTSKQGKELADTRKIKYYETSAKKNINVLEAFDSLFKKIIKHKKEKKNIVRDSIRVSVQPIKQNQCYC